MSKLDQIKLLGAQKRSRNLEPKSAPVEKVPVVPRTEVKLGRPLAKDSDKSLAKTKPWESEGVSRRTWYRRQADKAFKK